MMPSLRVAIVSLVAFSACASSAPCPKEPAPLATNAALPSGAAAPATAFFQGNLREAIEKNKLPEGEKTKLFPLFENADHTVNVIQTRGAVPTHYHAEHDELVMILDGGGKFTIEGKTQDVKAGDVLVIPRGAVHGFVHEGQGVTAVVSVFSPKFDPKDRIMVQPKP